ncbi:D-2-hydroxyacid dehydrogenase [Segnochrobactrum spirostomi]|uniref:D-2-hydroxyacid dehydrogenase n=1 Tax=Segnochrobactrum spirostomi TaxID=2608987 RepID=A0A6A7Y978_9HYPH|nr:D-2-hydroxyacid dehydrogenase [Segnochrobactrum spirostomi]MQT15436.1 D-2-hydroxyacid dehydrogenase [Segnochrobactrum spirostomi]
MHIHIETQPGDLLITAEALTERLALAGFGDDLAAGRLSVSQNAEPARFPDSIGAADVLIAGRLLDIAAAKAVSPALRWVQTIAAGVERFLPGLPADVQLTNASGVHGAKGGEFVLAAVLTLNYAIPGFVDDKAARRWAPSFGAPVAGKSCVLLGVGGIGAAAASALRQRGVRVTGVTRSGTAEAELDDMVPVDRLDTVLPHADFVVSTLPLTPETAGLMGRSRLESLKPGCGVVVVGRADVFDYTALADLLTQGRLGGAVLDVFPVEPLPPAHPLWDCPRLIITPHCSVDDHTIYVPRCLDIFADNLGRLLAGRPLANLVDRARGY